MSRGDYNIGIGQHNKSIKGDFYMQSKEFINQMTTEMKQVIQLIEKFNCLPYEMRLKLIGIAEGMRIAMNTRISNTKRI